MSIENVEEIKADIVETTEGIPGARTYPTGVRLRAARSNTYGYGTVDAVRAVTGLKTTTGDVALLGGAAVGAGSWLLGMSITD